MKWMLATLFLFSSFAFAEKAEDCEDETTKDLKPVMAVVAKVAEGPSCPNPNSLKNICIFVDSRTKDPKPQGDYIYTYQRKILEAACADPEKDSEEKIAEKVQAAWLAGQDNLKCKSIQFDASGGNILKYAVSSKFDLFLEDAIYWKVNLNRIDEVDQRTVLDYIQIQIEKHKGTNIVSKLQHYYKILREAGAKHKSEL